MQFTIFILRVAIQVLRPLHTPLQKIALLYERERDSAFFRNIVI